MKKEWRKLVWDISWIARGIFYFLLSIGVVIGLIALLVWIFRWAPEAYRVINNYEVLRDTLTIVLAVLAVGIAAVGYGAYRLISERIKADVVLTARRETFRASGRLLTYVGYAYWKDFEVGGYTEPRYRDMAISLTEDAYADYASRLDDKDRENQRLICDIRNNLAYYYAYRQLNEDRDKAREYAEYIHKKLSHFPESREAWVHTYNFVQNQYPA